MFNIDIAFDRNVIGKDAVLDFGDGNDRLMLDKTTFEALNSVAGSGFSRGSDFAIVNNNSQVANSFEFILYSATTGDLFYNENGSSPGLGSGGAFAYLEDTPTIAANDFMIVD